jgi:hypothetical protein
MIFRRAFSRMISSNEIMLLLIFGFTSLSSFSQSLETVDLKEVPQKKIRKYIHARAIDQMHDFSAIHASWRKGINESDFHVIEKKLYLKKKLSVVWESYRNANLPRSWNKHYIRLGLLISKKSNSVTYPGNSTFPAVDTGQVYFLNLRLLKGLFNVPTAFEIINIDPKKQIMEFSYLDDNKSRGKQTIQFFDNGDGRTRIIHRSYFKSDSWFRDALLYPYFHKKIIAGFHRNMRQLVCKT